MPVVTYSPSYTLVPTYECFNRCSYCNFRVDPGQGQELSLGAARDRLAGLKGVCEILILSGEVHPQSQERSSWLERLWQLGRLALDLGFLPHTNAGPLSYREMARLREVNVSMGLMLEQLTPKLLETVHRYAPSKRPEVRCQQLIWAGELGIPFTTGLLLGIGETSQDWRESLEAIAIIQQRYGHIQEVILQPYSPGTKELVPQNQFLDLVPVVALARQILPPEVVIQIPPNLARGQIRACVEAGARDLGGLSPIDEVNPDYSHPHQEALQKELGGWQLQPRLPVYPQYDRWLPSDLQRAVKGWREWLLDQCQPRIDRVTEQI